MSRKQDQRLVNAYERVVKGEPPRLDEAKKGREFTASLAKWATQRAKDVVKGVKFLEDSVKKKSANDILASISGIESHLGEMKKSMATVVSEEANVTAKNLKKGMNIPKFGKVDNVSKQGHIVIVYSGKTKKKYDENESVGIINEMGMVIGTPLSRRRDATPTPQIDEQKWKTDPFSYRLELADRLKNVARFIDGIHVSDRYYSGVDHDKKLKAGVDKAFTALTKAVDNLEKVMNKHKGI